MPSGRDSATGVQKKRALDSVPPLALMLTGELMCPIAAAANSVSDIRVGFSALPVWTDDQEALHKSHWPLAPDRKCRGTQPCGSSASPAAIAGLL